MASGPLIGVTLDYEEQGGYSSFPYYALRQNYFDAIEDAGGIPLALTHAAGGIDRLVSLLDGLVIPGGAFDIPPSYYGDASVHESVTLKEKRTVFEFSVTNVFYQAQKPILGICGGEQLINVVLGGSLIQDIASEKKGALAHEVKNRLAPAHEIEVVAGTLLHRVVGVTRLGVNSSHHQAVNRIAPSVTVNATAADGIVEGIESTSHPFCLGVQWHPEYRIHDYDRKIFDAFVAACR